MTFGEFFTLMRKDKGMSMNGFCKKYGFNQSTVSQIESGIMNAPQSPKKLNAYAKALGLKKNDVNWIRFHDLANASNRTFEVKNITSQKVLECVAEFIRMIDRATFTQDEALNLAKIANTLLVSKASHVE